MPPRDYRDDVIEILADREAALHVQLHLQRAMLLDQIDRQRAEVTRLQRRLDALQAELRRYTSARVRPARSVPTPAPLDAGLSGPTAPPLVM